MKIELEKSFFPVSFTSSEYLSLMKANKMLAYWDTCQLMSIFYSNIGLL